MAAGASTRMGSPKALLPVQGEPAIVRVARTLKQAGCDPVIAVVGAEAEKIIAVLPPDVQVVKNPQWAKGRSTSVKAALKALPGQDMLFWPVDHPAVALATLQALMADTGAVRVPVFNDRRGHPVLFEKGLSKELASLGDDAPLHDVVHGDPSRVNEVFVEDPGILLNVDRPEDLPRLAALLGGGRAARPLA